MDELRAYLESVYEPQANVVFRDAQGANLIQKHPTIAPLKLRHAGGYVLLGEDWRNPFLSWITANSGAVGTSKVLFFISHFHDLANAGISSEIEGPFAVVATLGLYNPTENSAHELGHLYGLTHPWEPSTADIDTVPDTPSERLMGYKLGTGSTGRRLIRPEWDTLNPLQ